MKPAKEQKIKYGQECVTTSNFVDTIEDIEFQRLTTESEFALEPQIN